MFEFFNQNPAYAWVMVGLVLTIIELLAPGTFFVWIGLAAFITGGFTGLLTLSTNGQLLIFAILTISCVVLGKRIMKKLRKNKIVNEIDVSDRTNYLVGKIVALEKPLQNGEGQARIGDSIWLVYHDDSTLTLPAGSQVQVVEVKNGKLHVIAV